MNYNAMSKYFSNYPSNPHNRPNFYNAVVYLGYKTIIMEHAKYTGIDLVCRFDVCYSTVKSEATNIQVC